MALNDYNDFISIPYDERNSPRFVRTADNTPSQRSEKLAGQDLIEYDVVWTFGKKSDLEGLVSEFDSVRYTRGASWSPIGAGTTEKYRFVDFSTTAVQRGSYTATATLRRFNGV